MITRPQLLALLKDKCGYNVDTPDGSTRLLYAIEDFCGHNRLKPLSRSTVRRLTGLNPPTDPSADPNLLTASRYTLDIVARFLGMHDWTHLEQFVASSSSDFRVPNGVVDMRGCRVGSEVELRWAPSRRVVVRHLGQGQYCVIKSENSKLRPSDLLALGSVMPGFPLIVADVVRDGRSLGPYTAAPEYGLESVTIITK